MDCPFFVQERNTHEFRFMLQVGEPGIYKQHKLW